jgi:DNA-binding NtrC family response regulator
MIFNVLLIEDEDSLRIPLKKLLELKQYQVFEAQDYKAATKKIRANHYDIYLLDIKLPDKNGISLLKEYNLQMRDKTIIITAHATIQSSVEAVKNGAFYYLEKPLDEELLFIQMSRITEMAKLKKSNIRLKQELIPEYSAGKIIYKSKQMKEIILRTTKLSQTDDSILIQGETGVGKEIIANFLYRNSRRKDNVFLPLNCANIPEQLFESELFGFKKGAFTGANDHYNGRFIQANKGTLFLDEIGEMPLNLQSKLLRILDDKTIYQLGSRTPREIDVRIITATNKNLWKEIQANRFRKDLYYRLKGCLIYIPPLRERKEDIMPLVFHFIQLFNTIYEKRINHITKEAENYLKEYSWGGNVRELKNTIKSIFSLKDNDTITFNDVLLSLRSREPKPKETFLTLEEYQRKYIKEVLEFTEFNVKKASELLNISRGRLYRKIQDV